MMPKYDVQVILARTYTDVDARNASEAMGKATAWAEAWAKREETKDGKTLKVTGSQTISGETFHCDTSGPPPKPA